MTNREQVVGPPQAGDLAVHRDLDSRIVSRVSASSVWLEIGQDTYGPFPIGNYTYQRVAPPAIEHCECVARDPDATRYHGGNADGCHRPPADHSPIVTSPALCMACLFGCAE